MTGFSWLGSGVVLFGLLSALSWGSGDFCGGIASRRGRAYSVVMVAEFVGAVVLILLALITGERWPDRITLLWSGGAGVAGLIGLLALYMGLASGQMGVVAPLSAVIGGVVPIAASLVIDGVPAPLQIAGFLVALVAVWLLAGSGEFRPERRQVILAAVAGMGFGLYFVLVERASRDEVYWTLAVARIVAGLALVLYLAVTRQPLLPRRDALPLAVVAGFFDGGGNLFFALAAQSGRLDVASILASLYPGTTVLLARLFLQERLTRTQAIGVAAALGAVVLIAL